MKYIIDQDSVKTRLDKFLVKQCPEFSRSRIKKLIEQGKIKVNGKDGSAHYFLKQGDAVEAELGEPQKVIVKANENIMLNLHNTLHNTECCAEHSVLVVPIVYEEKDFLVIDKPAGLVVHQGEGHKDPDTLANGLLAKYPEIVKIGDDPIRPGIVHRLDADVSGVMVIAKTQDMFDHLKRQFKLHEIEKEYVAIVKGSVSPPQGVISFLIDRKGAKMVARAKGQEGKMAVTEYETLEIFKNLNITRLKLTTRTGRTHQIRVHLKAKGWPIVGDRLYGSKLSKLSKVSKSSRLMLHARKIGFRDLKGERREFIIEPSKEFFFPLLSTGQPSAQQRENSVL